MFFFYILYRPNGFDGYFIHLARKPWSNHTACGRFLSKERIKEQGFIRISELRKLKESRKWTYICEQCYKLRWKYVFSKTE